MKREIQFELSSPDDIFVSFTNEYGKDIYYSNYEGEPIFAGYEGENEATRLSFTFSSEFDDYVITLLLADNTELELSDNDYYDIQDEYIVGEDLEFKVKAASDDQILISQPILLKIKRW